MWSNGENLSKKGVIFLKILIFDFSDIFWILFWFLLIFNFIKNITTKGVYISTRPAELMWRVGPARMRHGMQGHVAAPRGPTCWGGTDAWQGHASPRERPGGAMWHEWWAGRWWAHGLVGPGKSIGAVTQRRYTAPRFILTCSIDFLYVGLCSWLTPSLQDTWQNKARWMQLHQMKCVDAVDLESTGSPSQHVR